ncbi:MAG: GatB/YqeY domain-containing protein [Gammaproteobacteria bacterium]|nr:GatB/YqeY domain-containing protein [Gammaproteobacteria bacterium]MDE1886967.1 GatB/YqeY domain-containing protein [Gammaproteobacteria bacterium]MDE2023306.1 GatB/YqeY domain-containing protein [Gammaproteobacteria bacterium]MDE2273153.1 GatB/YqeY domain-containing protein [Gammaproteobacteria bacterium]
MPLKDRITADMKNALRAGDKPRLGVLRLMLAAIKQREVDERIQLDDAQVLTVLDKMLKQRRESIAQYEKGQRADLVAQEQAEAVVIQSYLPARLAEAELDKLIADAVQKSGAASMRDMGKVMGLLKPQVQGRADMGAVSARIKAKLGG